MKNDGLGYGWVGKLVDIMLYQVWLDGYTLGSSLWLNAWDLRLGWAVSLKYIREVFNIRNGMKL